MAKQYQINDCFEKVNRHNVAYLGLFFAASLCFLILLTSHAINLSIDSLIAYANGLFILIYLAAGIAGVKLLKGKGKCLAIIASLTCCVLFLALGWKMVFAVLLMLVLVLYYAVIYPWNNRMQRNRDYL